ncbi:MAG: class I SAM-dependent methyltransferase [Bacteroidales bacterium]|nr:class I SAM-dependent methyltransferase [Bacteroidales bacterium]
MENEFSSIHEFDFNLICEYFSSVDRQGPGSVESALKALGFIDNLNEDSKIIDLGCGTGTQTITVANNVPGKVFALDLFPLFVSKLDEKIKEMGLDNKISTIVGSMDKLPFDKNFFDLIWCEGAVYNIGFRNALTIWKDFLNDNGYAAVTEVSWLTEKRPKEIEDFWMDAYNEIDTVSNKIKVIEQCGYKPVAAFVLPENCWTDNFYIPQIKAQYEFLNKYPDNPTASSLVESQRHEFELYKKYSSYYGYVFYIAKKI